MNASEIIQRLQDSKINGMISWFFDGEWRWAIGDDLNGWKLAGKADSFEAAVRELAENALAEFFEKHVRQLVGDAAMSGAITLGYIAEHLPMLNVQCDRCGRQCRYSTAKLVVAGTM